MESGTTGQRAGREGATKANKRGMLLEHLCCSTICPASMWGMPSMLRENSSAAIQRSMKRHQQRSGFAMSRTVSFLAGQHVLRGVRPAYQEVQRKVFQEGEGWQPRVVCEWSTRCRRGSGQQMAWILRAGSSGLTTDVRWHSRSGREGSLSKGRLRWSFSRGG